MQKSKKKYWNINKATGIFLNLLIKDRKYKTILEIGTSNGYSGIWIAKALRSFSGHKSTGPTSRRLYTIESHKKRFLLACRNFKKSRLNRYITPILGHAPEKIPLHPRYFDMAFFDATKYEHPTYFKAIKNRIKKGGLIIADNSKSHRKELAEYFKLIQNSKRWTSFELNIGDGLLIARRKH